MRGTSGNAPISMGLRLWASERQNSINDVGSPRWRQNKFQLHPREIGFPRSIRGLRIVERFHASDRVPFFFNRTVAATDPPLVSATFQQSLCRKDYEINNSLQTDVLPPRTARRALKQMISGCISFQQVQTPVL